MSGILKDILLVIASIVLFRDPVTGQQFFGYSIALGGLIYYKLGGEALQTMAKESTLRLTELRQKHPAALRYAIGIVVLFSVTLVWLLWIRTG